MDGMRAGVRFHRCDGGWGEGFEVEDAPNPACPGECFLDQVIYEVSYWCESPPMAKMTDDGQLFHNLIREGLPTTRPERGRFSGHEK